MKSASSTEGNALFIVDQTAERMHDAFIEAAFDHLDWFNGDRMYYSDAAYCEGRVRFAFNRLEEPGVFLAL